MLISRAYIFVAGLALAVFPYFLIPDVLQRYVDRKIGDVMLAIDGSNSALQGPGRVLIIEVDAGSLSRLGGDWPPPPKVLETLIKDLDQLGAGAIGIDARFGRRYGQKGGVEDLIKAIGACQRVVLKDSGGSAAGGITMGSTKAFNAAAFATGSTQIVESSGSVSRHTVLTDDSYVVQLIRALEGKPDVILEKTKAVVKLQVKSLELPLERGGGLRLDYRFLPKIQRISFLQVSQDILPENAVRNRIVLIAPTVDGLTERHFAPTGREVPEGTLDAIALESLLSGQVLRDPPSLVFQGGYVVISALLILILIQVHPMVGILFWVAGQLLIFSVVFAMFTGASMTGEILRPSLGLFLFAGVTISIRVYELLLLGGGRGVGGLDGEWAARKLYNDGITCMEKREHGQAIDLIQQAIQLAPDLKNEGLYRVLICHIFLGDLEVTEPMLEALDLDKLSNEQIYEIVVLLKDRLLTEEAKQLAHLILTRDSGFRDVKEIIDSLKKMEDSSTDILEATIIRKLANDYRGLNLVSRGGMALIFRGQSLSLGRPVALKVLAPHLNSDEGLVFRFFSEAETLQRFDHPNIVKVFELHKTGNVRHYVMENCHPARSGQEIIEADGRIAQDRAVHIVKQMLEALAYSHSESVIHRDIKPGNVMIGAEDHVTLIDFGIARFEEKATMTRAGTVLGTPRYMSPEQYRGERIDQTTDLYSTAVMFFELLTGETGTENPVVEKLKGKPTITQIILRQNLPTPLVSILLKALEVRPEKRFQSANEMRDALIEFEATPHEHL